MLIILETGSPGSGSRQGRALETPPVWLAEGPSSLCSHPRDRALVSGVLFKCASSIGSRLHLNLTTSLNVSNTITWGLGLQHMNTGGIILSTAPRKLKSSTHHWQKRSPNKPSPPAWDYFSYSQGIGMVIFMQISLSTRFQKDIFRFSNPSDTML